MGDRKRKFGWLGIGWLGMALLLGACSPAADKADAGGDLQRIAARYPALKPERAETETVKRTVDGDTFVLASGEKVRLIGVNTPEIHGSVQPYGKEAAAYADKRLTGKSVVLYADVSDRDKYGRLLRYVFVSGEDVMFNEELVSEGYAQVMTVPPNVAFADTFVARQREARSRGAGLWGLKAGNDGRENGAPETQAGNAPPPCPNPIKGNINSKGEKIYHLPGGRSYAATKPEQWFCSEQEAVDAGFRKAAR